MTWSVELETGERVALAEAYGHEHAVEVPGSHSVRVVLSPANQRVQVLAASGPDFPRAAALLDDLARRNGFGKIWVKARASDERHWLAADYRREAAIPGYFRGTEDAVVMAKFPLAQRLFRPDESLEDEILAKALAGPRRPGVRPLPQGYTTALFTDADAPELARLYAVVFPSYPYPITNPDYLVETAATNIVYRLVRNGEGELVAAASAETYPEQLNAEMTDFASLPSERGKGLAQFLLARLEEDAALRFGTVCHYTIARAASAGMLRTFHHGGYGLTGTLVNNCHISGRFETMHVLVRGA